MERITMGTIAVGVLFFAVCLALIWFLYKKNQHIKWLVLLQSREKKTFQREYTGNIAHELKTPLFLIQGYLYNILDNDQEISKTTKEQLEKALAHSERMHQLLKDLDFVHQMEKDSIAIHPSYFDIEVLCREIIFELQHLADIKSIQLEIVVHAENTLVWADRNRLYQVIENLITNGIAYNQTNGKVSILLNQAQNKVQLCVTDTGIGIAEKDITHIFERFYRVESSRNRQHGGAGIGLAVVKQILDAHGMSIQVESALGKGSSFCFLLPNIAS